MPWSQPGSRVSDGRLPAKSGWKPSLAVSLVRREDPRQSTSPGIAASAFCTFRRPL